jgi:NADPH-dependent 2,4-dienoyl-CoA reductase/sulfur reductase-like enzyme
VSETDADLLIAGGGLAAQRCCEMLRRLGFDGRIVVLCAEQSPPYDRPPLSKSVLSKAHEPEAQSFRPAAWYEEHGVELLLGVAAVELDPAERTVLLGARPGAGASNGARAGERLRYDKLLVATGSAPRRLPGIRPGGPVHELRTYEDALALRAALRQGSGRLAILGAGLIGMEVAAAARALGREVTLIEAADRPLARVLPRPLGAWMAYLHRLHGVDVRLASAVERVALREGRARLRLSDAGELEADTVLLAAGVSPATDWLASTGIAAGAVRTDAGGRTALPGVYAAGDAACFPDPYLGQAVPSQHWEAAVRQGVAVARSIVGLPPAPAAPSMFWSDQHGHRIQFVGHAPADCEIELDGDPGAGQDFVAWISRGGRTRGALLVDRPQALPAARARIADEAAEAALADESGGGSGAPDAASEKTSKGNQQPKRGALWPAYR